MADTTADIQKFITASEETSVAISQVSGYSYVYEDEIQEETYYLDSGQYKLTKRVTVKEGPTKNNAWHTELKRSAKITKEQISSGTLSNKEVVERAIERITIYPKIKKMLQTAIKNHFELDGSGSNLDIRSLYNFMKYIPEINSFQSDKIISVDSDLSLVSLSIYKDNNIMHLVFDKNGEVVFNYSDKDMKKIRVSGSSYFSGEISNASQIKKLLNLV